MLADRLSAYAQWDLPLPQALHQEWERSKHCIAKGLQGRGAVCRGRGPAREVLESCRPETHSW